MFSVHGSDGIMIAAEALVRYQQIQEFARQWEADYVRPIYAFPFVG
jgi:hypothetical protein